MPLSLDIVVMAVPERKAHVDALVSRLQGQVEEARAAGCDVADVRVMWDTEKRGPWFNARQCWALPLEKSHRLVLQDDVVVCADLPQAVLAVLQHKGAWPVFLMAFARMNHQQLLEADCRWLRARELLNGQGIVLDRFVIQEMLAWLDANEAANPDWRNHDDVRVSAFLSRKKRWPLFVPLPSLIDHVGHRDGIGSVMKHNFDPARRVSGCFIGQEGRGAEVDWSSSRTWNLGTGRVWEQPR